ncbi:MAG: asparagine synthetase B, partial [Bacteroidetes bacterium]
MEHLQPMAQAVSRRGPDGITTYCVGQASLCHLALHVYPNDLIDKQPLVDLAGDQIIVYDGRLDNRLELKESLGLKRSEPEENFSDAALILGAYRKWGLECAEHLLGDFAFAIWDASERRLYAARDAMGMRAFYYRAELGRFLFGTEVKQILEAPDVPCEINETSVAAHLVGYFGKLSSTFYEGIDQLEPAHVLVVDEAGVKTWRFWDIDPEKQIWYSNYSDYYDHFREVYIEAVRSRIDTIRPIGIMLSGGIDSGAIASTAAWLA